jgi:hypothetical protein
MLQREGTDVVDRFCRESRRGCAIDFVPRWDGSETRAPRQTRRRVFVRVAGEEGNQ